MDIENLVLEDIPLELLHTPAKFAKATGISEHIVRHWIAEGVIPTYRIKRRVFVNLPKLKENLLKSVARKQILKQTGKNK